MSQPKNETLEAFRRAKTITGKTRALCKARGGHCEKPGCTRTGLLEWAHTRKTRVNGRARGMTVRAYDVLNHPRSYKLLCHKHHVEQMQRRRR
ncbi:hypothetical protein MUP00_00625 [Candidatus Bathyarchaeota archaeon]|nr:hypothetical protein [Candidatus Bathyarchaeota archaeon]